MRSYRVLYYKKSESESDAILLKDVRLPEVAPQMGWVIDLAQVRDRTGMDSGVGIITKIGISEKSPFLTLYVQEINPHTKASGY